MPRTIIVSDLHVDTWEDELYGQGSRRKTKLDHWRDLLDWCAARNADLVINGDLMDAPPYQGDRCFTTGPARGAVEALLAYAKDNRVTYIYGNHDIGVSGLRCPAGEGIAALRQTGLWYPRYTLTIAGSVVLLEHGHFYDPALILYMRDLAKRTYLPSHFEAFQLVQQRRDPQTGERIQHPGVAPPTTVDLSRGVENNVYGAIQVTDFESPTPEPEKRTARSFLDWLGTAEAARNLLDWFRRRIVPKAAKEVKHYLWWPAAQGIFRNYLSKPGPKPMTLYCVMGHTHVPDTGETTVADVPCTYLNSGTWTCAGDTPAARSYATYLDLRETGKLWAQDWIWDRWDA
ncbi:MAG: metallophosphoesterase [Armatimonadota bacterium]